MTIKKLWLGILILISLIAVSINAIILTTLTDKYFMNFLTKDYEKNVEKIINYTKLSLTREDLSLKQMTVELEMQLNEPIVGIKLYSPKGDLLVEVSNFNNKGMGKMRGMGQKEVQEYKIFEEKNLIGTLHIIKHGSAKTSMMGRVFKSTLIWNSSLAMIIALIISIIIGIFVSKKMSNALIKTAELADDIQFGLKGNYEKSSIREINQIRESLNDLNTRLKIKQKNRKELIDQLIHQTRTPLTILKSHLEGINDGVIQMDKKESEILNNQIENITFIIGSMSGMIDANKEADDLKIEKVELNSIFNQIISGIKPQYDKRNMNIAFSQSKHILIETDRYKLSQIIYNLLTNAYKYSSNNSTVKIEFDIEDSFVNIGISDNGIGIKKEDLGKIFDAYYRSNDALNVEGEGIGLYVAKKNIEQLKGSIEVFSEFGKGTKFQLKIPTKNYT